MLKLTYSNLEFPNFPGRNPGPPLQGKGRQGEGWGGEVGEREEKEGGKDREGRGGTGSDRGEEGGRGGMGGGEVRGARHGLRPHPLETSSGSAPVFDDL